MKKLNAVLRVCVVVLFAAVLTVSCKKDESPYTAEREAKLIEDWLAAMEKNNKDVLTTSSGIHYIVEKAGEGEFVKAGDEVTVKYTGMFLDGTVFDASAYHNEAGTMTYVHKTDRLIDGWEEGIELMKKGGSTVFLIPSAKGYGVSGYSSIPPYSPLIFIIEVVDIK